MTKIYLIDDGESHWYAANSPEEAKEMHWKLWYDLTGESLEEQMDNWEISEVDPQKEISIIEFGPSGETVTKTAEEFAKIISKGFLWSSVFSGRE